jgi:hypothetical protein
MTMHEWGRELLTERIRDLNGTKFTIAGNAYPNYGAPNVAVADMIKRAIRHVEADELNEAERWCERAELAQIAGIRECRHG